MQSAWDNSEGPAADDTVTSPQVEASVKKTAQELGWTAPIPINYEAAKSKDHVQPSQQITAKYEYAGEVGDLGPEVPELEAMLFNNKFRVVQGDMMEKLGVYDVHVEGPKQVKLIHSFQDAGLHPNMLKIIDLVGYRAPTPIQQYTIPAVNQGQDLIAIAQTGSGKTAAYLIPIVSRLTGKAKKWCAARPDPTRYDPQVDATRAEPLVLIVCPTRELAMQIFDETRRFCYRSMLRPCVVYGGAPRREQLEDLKRGCDILIGTPGRLKDFVETESRWLSLKRLKYTILDEADEMIQPDWEEHMKSILGGAAANNDEDHHFMMFSATFTKDARAMAAKYLEDDHIKISVGRSGSVHGNIAQDVIWVDQDQKMQALFDLISSMPPCRTLVFCNNNGQCDTIDDFLYNENFPVTSMHSGRTQYEREDAIRSFRTGKCPIMVTSNVAARGLDVKNVMHIINYDMPSGQYGGIQEYVHRIGRTARMGNMGQSSSFYNDRNEDIAADLVNILLETGQNVPDFLEQFKDASGKAVFEDDKSDAGDEGGATVGEAGGWGDDAAAPEKKGDTGAGWGAEEAAPAAADDLAW